MKYWQGINKALHEEMERDPKVLVMGEDVAAAGGAFGVTRGLLDQFGPVRVRDTPICENGIVGLAVGSAAVGMRPVVEILFMDFCLLAMDQIVNQAAKYRYFSGGKPLPLVIRTMCGVGGQHGAQHSQTFEAWLAQTPGLKVAFPSNATDAMGLLKSAIRDDDPVIFVELQGLLTARDLTEVADDHLVPLGKAAVKRSGNDLTIVAYGRVVNECVKAAEELEKIGISAEIIDLRSLAPMDHDCYLESLRKTNRLMIAHDALGPFGVGAEITAKVMEEAFDSLDAPVLRVTPEFTNVPASQSLADARLPGVDQIIETARRLCVGR